MPSTTTGNARPSGRGFGKVKAATMNIKLVLLGCLMILAGLTACGGPSTGVNGFLSDYSKLEKNPRYAGSRIYANPETPLKNYSRFIVNPVQVRLSSVGAYRGCRPG